MMNKKIRVEDISKVFQKKISNIKVHSKMKIIVIWKKFNYKHKENYYLKIKMILFSIAFLLLYKLNKNKQI